MTSSTSGQTCDTKTATAHATFRLVAIDSRLCSGKLRAACATGWGKAMGLLVVFLVMVIVGQSISISLALIVERIVSPDPGLRTFIALYFTMFWVAWKLSLRITAPNTRLGGWLQSFGK
jgi:hypothetical protein